MLARISSILDLTLNTVGTLLGALCFLVGFEGMLAASEEGEGENGGEEEIPAA